jgi:hypothetical protein
VYIYTFVVLADRGDGTYFFLGGIPGRYDFFAAVVVGVRL